MSGHIGVISPDFRLEILPLAGAGIGKYNLARPGLRPGAA